MAGRCNNPVQCGRESAHKSKAVSGNSTLGDCTWRDQHLQGAVGEHQRGLGEVSCCRLCRAKTVRRCFCACANIFLRPRFCRRQYFVNANILSARIFRRREYFLAQTFCRCQCFVGANILSTPMFCRRKYFAAANILPPPIFCCHQYFVCV